MDFVQGMTLIAVSILIGMVVLGDRVVVLGDCMVVLGDRMRVFG